MGLQFDRPVGAPRDVAELEYCSALRQTDTSRPLRANGSLTADDVRLHILSRHGVVASITQVEQSILVELAGSQEYTVQVIGGSKRKTRKQYESLLNSSGATSVPNGDGEKDDKNNEEDDEEEEILVPPPSLSQKTGDEGEDEEFNAPALPPSDDLEFNKKSTSSSSSPPPLTIESRRVTPLDLCQQASLLLIPELKKLAVAHKRQETPFAFAAEPIQPVPIVEPVPSHTRNEMAVEQSQVSAADDTVQDPCTPGNDNQDKHTDQQKDPGDMTTTYRTPPPSGPPRRRPTMQTSHYSRRSSIRRLLETHDVKDPLPTADLSVIDVALLVLLENAGVVYGVELTHDVMKQILMSLGEEYWKEGVIDEMIRQARGPSWSTDNNGGKPLILDTETFLRALTGDLELYDEQTEEQVSTHFADVNSSPSKTRTIPSSASSSPPNVTLDGDETENATSPALTRVFTAPSIDYTADTFSSLTWAVLVWYLLAGFFFLYMLDELGRRLFPLSCNEAEFGCKIANGIVLWLEIMIKLCIVGFAYIMLSTLGNSGYLLGGALGDDATRLTKLKSAAAIVVSFATVLLSTFVARHVKVDAVIFETKDPVDDYYAYTDPEEADNLSDRSVLIVTSLVIGAICLAIQALQLIRVLLPRNLNVPRLFDLGASSANTLERKTKQAASYKVRTMMEHAVSCHQLTSSPFDNLATSVKYDAKNGQRFVALNVDGRISHALVQYQERMLLREQVGGVMYTLKGFLRDGNSLATKEGVWIFPRLLWCHLGQWIVVIGFMVFIVGLPITLAEQFELEGLTPQELQAIVVSGGVIAAIACLGTVTRYIPSAVTTMLAFRSGVYGSLRDNRSFHVYRFAQDTSTALFGSCLWGLLFSGGMIWIFFSLIVAGFVWDTTRELFLSFLAQIIGVVVTIIIKIVAMQLLRRTWFGGFYRRHPAGANFFTVLIECWNLALSSGYILARSLKFIVLSILYISRVDTPFLAPGVGWLMGNIPLDGYPIAFQKDVLIHEAHRHPYMERWAMLYLLKLRHGNKFGTPAGAAWRILFTLALMPWLRQYRVHPQLRTSWSSTHSASMTQTGRSYEELYAKNQQLELELKRMKQYVACLQEGSPAETHL